ncbi:MAG: helix-turn-helix transcriptional regulator [Clostridia bacterium]|nr:helix-turn-helix transcriptional regulator [Clostridia bacterium]
MNENNRTFIKLFWSYAMIIILPVFVLGFLTIGILFQNLASDTKNLNMNIMEQSVNIIDTEVEKTLSLFFKIEQSDKIQNFVGEHIYNNNIGKYDLYDISTELSIMRTDNSISPVVGFYLKNKNCVITNNSVTTLEEFYDITFASEDFTFEDLKERLNMRGFKNYVISHKNGDGEDVIMCYKNMNVDGNLNYATVFAIWDKDFLLSKMELADTDKNFEFAIVDSNNTPVVKSDGFEVNYANPDNINGSSVISMNSRAIDCRYVYKLPKGGLAGNVRYITLIFVLLMLLTVFVSVILAFWHMQKMKTMILGIFNESKGLEDSLSEQLENAKERILSNLLHNIRTDAINSVETMAKYGINFSKKYFAVMTVSDTQADNSEIYSSVEESAWGELNNIVKTRIAEMHMNCEMVRTGSNSYSYILNFDGQNSTAVLKALPAEIMKSYNIAINMGIGAETENIDKLYSSYEGSISALRFGLNERPGEAVFYEEIHSLENEKIYYTGEKEKQLIRNIKMGMHSNVGEILDEIYRVNFKERHISHSMLKRLIFNMSLTVYKVLDEAYEPDVEKHEKYGRVCQNLFRNDNVEECFAILREICLSLCNDIGQQSGDDAIKCQIVDYIADHYSDDSLSLEVLAEHMEISYHYLSRLFKEYLGTNFVSYLTLVRLEKAKELLKNTDETIENVAAKTGFVGSNSLIRAFKKYYDITPGKFRKS